jgi:hypothetical protein
MRHLLIAVMTAGVLAGCGAAAQTVYVKPGATQAEFQRDEQACLMQAVGAIENKIATFSQTINREAFDDCMRARGWDVQVGSASAR